MALTARVAVRPGAVVAWWDRSALQFGVVAGEQKERVRVVLARGKEERVRVSRIAAEVVPPGVAPGSGLEERRRAGERAVEAEQAAGRRAAEVDVALVWEIAREAAERPEEHLACDPGELAGLALDATDGEALAAVFVALVADGIHFYRRADEWIARPPAVVEELKLERRQIAKREAETLELFDALAAAAAGESFRSTGTAAERRYLEALERLAVDQDAVPAAVSRLALEALSASGLRSERPHEGAFRLLRCTGRFDSDDENLQPLRFGLRTQFAPPILDLAARAARRGFDRDGRVDLTGIETLSIDGPHTLEIDDVVSCEPRGTGGCRVGVHIADPAAFFEPGDEIDDEALTRSLTYYMPGLRLPMLPPAISEVAASLMAGEERPALSFLADLDAAGEIESYEIVRSIVRSRIRLDYASADRTLASGEGPHAEVLAALRDAAAGRRAARVRSGAVLIHAPEVDLYLADDGSIELDRLPGDSQSRDVVTEAMILAGELAARFCSAAELPVIYRRQSAPRSPLNPPADGVRGAVEVRRARMAMSRAEAGLVPGPHFSLGLEAYVQVTSPIRRYRDLACHRQILAALRSAPPPYDVEGMQRVLASTEQAEQDSRRAERAAEEYWVLRYLEGRTGEEIDAIVVQSEPRPVVQLLETLREQAMEALAGVEPGRRIRLRVERVNPRAGVCALQWIE